MPSSISSDAQHETMSHYLTQILHSSSHSRHHACPSGRWPVPDYDSDQTLVASPPPPSEPRRPFAEGVEGHSGGEWASYPQSMFFSWTRDEMNKRGVRFGENRSSPACELYLMDVIANQILAPVHLTCSDDALVWKALKPHGSLARVIYVQNLNEPVMQMLGARFKVDPYFFVSSANWTTWRSQEKISLQEDRITITLKFPRVFENALPSTQVQPAEPHNMPLRIDTRAPLNLDSSKQLLFVDLLAIHMIRQPGGGVIISNHVASDLCHTSAGTLCSKMHAAGRGIIWQNVLKYSRDPTVLVLLMFWHALFSWDTALDALYEHFVCLVTPCFEFPHLVVDICIRFVQETQLMMHRDEDITQEIHVIRPHLFRYFTLLSDFRKSIQLIMDNPNPVMARWSLEERMRSKEITKKECRHLLVEIDRLEMRRDVLDKRLTNVLSLVSTAYNFTTSKQSRRLTEAAVKDSAAMKQISYLTMVFLPASSIATIFGMNIRELNPQSYSTFGSFFAVAIPLTAVTIWIIVAFQSKHYDASSHVSIWTRICWPVVFLKRTFDSMRRPVVRDAHDRTTDMV
ncbi:hypothetical protein HGRIS_007484 [Hohenbuehelia grisea]|uniref:Uncharacterized protein n=1 Tax=Hohenbuehelia grisea TaxID=104357 RepID=A0ABR3J5B3_9AGAR